MPQNENGQPLDMVTTKGCGLCPTCSQSLPNELSRPSPGDRGRRDPRVEKLQALRLRYKESGQLVKAMAITQAIEALK